MAEQTMAERLTGETTAPKAAPWWQRILRRAVDGLRSGFGLFKRSPAGKIRNDEEVSSSNIEENHSEVRNPAPEVQFAEKEEETELNRTSPNPESNSTVAEVQAVEAVAAQSEALHQPEAETIAAEEPGAPNGTDANNTGANDTGAKGTGFSPYVNAATDEGALAPEVAPGYEPGASAEPEAAQNPAEKPTEAALQNEELQIAVEQEETVLNEIPSTVEPESNAAQEPTVESAPAANEDLEQAEALPSAANEPIVIAGPETEPVPDPQEREAEALAPETAEAIESVPDPTFEEGPREEAIVADSEEEEIQDDSEPIETEGPEPEALEAVEQIADPPCEEAVLAESEAVAGAAVELPAETDATEEPDATQPADQPVESAHEEAQIPSSENASSENTMISQAVDAPEEAVVMESAELEESPEKEPAQEDESLETMEAAPEEAEPDQEESLTEKEATAEADSAPEPEPGSPEPLPPEIFSNEAPVVHDDALVLDESIGADESIKVEELPQPEGALPEAMPAAEEANIDLVEETNIDLAEETNFEGKGTIDAEPAESTDAPSAAPHSIEPQAAESDKTAPESETPVAEPEMKVPEPETAFAEPKTPVAEPEASSTSELEPVAEADAHVAELELSASEPEAAVAEPKPPAAEPEASAAKPPPPVAEPVPSSSSPVPAQPTAEERKKSDHVAAAMKARSQIEEQSPFSVAVGKIYEGPLDLLLDLIRKQDLDIYDIPIAKITAQFLAYVDRLRASDMDVAGDFIYTAALLIHIKSKMLLPREPAGPDDAGEDPRHELVERLLEHERFKNAAQMLQQKQLLEAATWTRSGLREFGEEADREPEIAADTVDLVRVFREVLERAANRPVMNLEEDAVTVGQMIRFLARRLNMDDRPVALRRLLSQTQSERMLIAMFLALLEMVRLQAVLLRQDRQFSEIFVKKHTGFDALMNEGLDNAKDDWR